MIGLRMKIQTYRLRISGAYNKVWGDHLLSANVSYSINENVSKSNVLSMKWFSE